MGIDHPDILKLFGILKSAFIEYCKINYITLTKEDFIKFDQLVLTRKSVSGIHCDYIDQVYEILEHFDFSTFVFNSSLIKTDTIDDNYVDGNVKLSGNDRDID